MWTVLTRRKNTLSCGFGIGSGVCCSRVFSLYHCYADAMGVTTTARDDRQRRHDRLANRIRACTHCDGMNEVGKTQSAPGYGSVRSPVVIVGQSLCGPCMKMQEPFYGGSGRYLNEALRRARRTKNQIYTTNVVHCHPPKNRESKPEEIKNCKPYLRQELAIVRPRLVIGFGDDAKDVLQAMFSDSPRLEWPLVTVRVLTLGVPGRPALLFPAHPGSFRWIPAEDRADVEEEWVDCLARALRWGFRAEPSEAKG